MFVCVAETDMEDKRCGEMHSQGEKQREYITLLFVLSFSSCNCVIEVSNCCIKCLLVSQRQTFIYSKWQVWSTLQLIVEKNRKIDRKRAEREHLTTTFYFVVLCPLEVDLSEIDPTVID